MRHLSALQIIPPHNIFITSPYAAHNSMIQHQSPQKSQRFWVIQITLGRYHKKGMWLKKWVTTLTLKTLASLPIIREKEQNSEDPQRKEVFQKGKFLSFLSEIWLLRIMWCKWVAWISSGEKKGEILGKDGVAMALMMLYLSLVSLEQCKAKHYTGAHFKCSFLIRKAFKEYLASACCGCNQISFKNIKDWAFKGGNIPIKSAEQNCQQWGTASCALSSGHLLDGNSSDPQIPACSWLPRDSARILVGSHWGETPWHRHNPLHHRLLSQHPGTRILIYTCIPSLIFISLCPFSTALGTTE